MNVKSITKAVSEDEDLMVQSLMAMLRIKAVGPESGGDGEHERGKYVAKLVKDLGFKSVEVLNSPDKRVPSGKRPNIIARLEGTTKRKMWVVSHMDTVPEGDLSAWKYPPYEPKLVEGRTAAGCVALRPARAVEARDQARMHHRPCVRSG
jgi:succinyl-diaminopimelate desuccinylase